jgi:hypothetical protein
VPAACPTRDHLTLIGNARWRARRGSADQRGAPPPPSRRSTHPRWGPSAPCRRDRCPAPPAAPRHPERRRLFRSESIRRRRNVSELAHIPTARPGAPVEARPSAGESPGLTVTSGDPEVLAQVDVAVDIVMLNNSCVAAEGPARSSPAPVSKTRRTARRARPKRPSTPMLVGRSEPATASRSRVPSARRRVHAEGRPRRGPPRPSPPRRAAQW